MVKETNSTSALEEPRIPVQAKLAAWTSLMFLYVCVDILGLHFPGTVDDILDGVVFEFQISQTWATGALMLMALSILMIVLSTTLPARANLAVASLYVLVSIAWGLATLVWPGGLAPALLLVTMTGEVCERTAGGVAVCTGSTLPVWLAAPVLVLSVVAPLIVGVVLLRRSSGRQATVAVRPSATR